MTRKLVAMLLCVMMLASVMTVPAFAEDAVSYADYVPGAKPESMITVTGNANDYNLQYFVNNGGSKTKLGLNYEGQYFNVNSLIEYDGTTTVGRNSYMLCGGQIYDEILTTPAAMNTNYVVSFWAKNTTEYETYVNFAPTVYKQYSISQYTKEYGAEGLKLTGTDWHEFKGTISIGSMNSGLDAQPEPRFCIGLSTNALAGTGATFSYNAEGTQKMYLAVEQAYDITNERTSASSVLTTKNPATFKAQIVNQIGLPGYINQGTFTWKAFAASDTERANPVSGFTFTGGADVTVTVDDTVEPGEYVIVAHNTEKGWAKGTSITVDTPSPYLDYTVGTMPENLIIKKDGTVYDLQYFSTNDNSNTKVAVSYNSYKQNYFSVVPKLAYDGTTILGRVATYYQPGAWTNTTILPASKMLQDETYVVKFKARNSDGNPANAKVNFAALNYKNYSTLDYTKEYGIDGMELTGSDWQWFKGTLHIKPETVANVAARFQIGLSVNALAGTGVDIWHNYRDVSAEDAVYIAYEQPYDITNTLTSDSATIKAGGSASFEAEILNQIGLPGYLDQTFTWKVLDRATRKLELEDVTVVSNGNTATLTTTKETAPGEYVVVAYNEANQMAKGVDITITEPNYYEDYVKGEMPANIYAPKLNTDLYRLQYWVALGASKISAGHTWTDKVVTYKSMLEYDGTTLAGRPASYRIGGSEIRTELLSELPENGETYVVRFKAKNTSTTPANAKVNFAFYNNYNYSSNDYTKEYGEEGMELTGTDWQVYKGTVKVNPKHSSLVSQTLREPIPDIGLSVKSLAGTSAVISGDDTGENGFYLAKEAAYDITNTLASGNATLADGSTASFKAQVVNQIELPGYLNQDIEWRVMNKARTEDVEGFVITEGTDGTATVTVDGAAPGTYDVVAYSADYKMAKGFEITVEPKEEVTLITVNLDEDGKAILEAAEITNSKRANIMFAIASYNGDKLVDADKVVVAVEEGVAALTDAIAITANAGNKIKVFVWDAADYTPVALAGGVVAEYTK